MKEEELKQSIFSLLKKIAPDTTPENLKPDDNIKKELNIDSFDYLQFMVAIDKQLGVSTPEEDYGKIQTLKELVKYLLAKTETTKAAT